jgi:hypothetical protein
MGLVCSLLSHLSFENTVDSIIVRRMERRRNYGQLVRSRYREDVEGSQTI